MFDKGSYQRMRILRRSVHDIREVNFFEFILKIKITTIPKHNSNAEKFQILYQGLRRAQYVCYLMVKRKN
jgi:hypothetical protein